VERGGQGADRGGEHGAGGKRECRGACAWTDPGAVLSGTVFVFRARRADRVKLIWWDGSGLCLFAKRLEQGAFRWPGIEDGTIRLSAAQLAALIEGMEWTRVQAVEPRAPMATQ